MSGINIMPELSDLLAGAVAGASSLANLTGGSPQNEFLEQLGSQLVGKVTAGYFDITNDLNSPNLGVTEADAWVGAVRAMYSGSQKRSGNRVAMDGVKGLLCSVVGKQLATKLSSTTSA